MAIHEADPWRTQYFETVECPQGIEIPTDDSLAWELNPRHCWVYNKLLVARSQGLPCGDQNAPPRSYPVFSKPTINLRGMGTGSRLLRSPREFRQQRSQPNFWMKYLTGTHVSTDWAVVEGEPSWCRHVRGAPLAGGTFDYWVVEAVRRPQLEQYCREWIRTNLGGYTGMVNIETIGGRIIEVHLRFTDQWPDLYGAGWMDAVVELYARGSWCFTDPVPREGYSVVLFGPHGVRYQHPPAARLASYCRTRDISSVQVTFLEHVAAAAHAMPPGGFRLAVINSQQLGAALDLRERMARDFGLEQDEPRAHAAPAA